MVRNRASYLWQHHRPFRILYFQLNLVDVTGYVPLRIIDCHHHTR
jgi:hypothetical protein